MKKDQNSIIKYLKDQDPKLFSKIVRTMKLYKGVDLESISQSDIMVLTPKEAFTYAGEEGDKYFKIWMVADKIAWCTWANTMIDSQFRWNAKAKSASKRDNNDLLGNEPYVSLYLKSNTAIDQCSIVYMFPFEAFAKKHDKRSSEKITSKPQKTLGGYVRDAMIEEDKERKEREELEKAQLAEIMAMRLNDTDPKILSQELLELGVRIDAINAFDFLFDKVCSALRRKHKNGILVLKTLDPQNPIIPELEDMQRTWNRKVFTFPIGIGTLFLISIIMFLLAKLFE